MNPRNRVALGGAGRPAPDIEDASPRIYRGYCILGTIMWDEQRGSLFRACMVTSALTMASLDITRHQVSRCNLPRPIP